MKLSLDEKRLVSGALTTAIVHNLSAEEWPGSVTHRWKLRNLRAKIDQAIRQENNSQ